MATDPPTTQTADLIYTATMAEVDAIGEMMAKGALPTINAVLRTALFNLGRQLDVDVVGLFELRGGKKR